MFVIRLGGKKGFSQRKGKKRRGRSRLRQGIFVDKVNEISPVNDNNIDNDNDNKPDNNGNGILSKSAA